MKATLRLCLLGIIIGLTASLLYPVLKDSFTPAKEAPLPQPDMTVPENGIRTDAFSLRLFHAALQQQATAGSVTVAPFSTKIFLGSMADIFNLTGEAQQEIAATQEGIDDSDSATPVALGIHFMADYDLPRKADAPPVEILPFRRDYPGALSGFNLNIADFFNLSYINAHTLVSQDTRLVGQELTSYAPQWLRSFHADDTKKDAFYNANGAMPQVSLMRCYAPFRVAEAPDGKWKAIALFFAPQQGKGQTPIAFIGILPQGDAREFAEQLTPQLLSEIRTALAKAPYGGIRAEIPRFILPPTLAETNTLLQAAGIAAPFDARKKTFAALTDDAIALNAVVQGMKLELKEEPGHSKDAALLDTDTPVFRLDRPFLWVIGDLTTPTAPYFIGLVENL